MEAIIDSLKKAGKIFYPKTKTKAVYDDNNNRLDNTLTSINDSLNEKAELTYRDVSVTTTANQNVKLGYFANFSYRLTGYTPISFTVIGGSNYRGFVTFNPNGNSAYIMAETADTYTVRIWYIKAS